jgi:hypothetical protein
MQKITTCAELERVHLRFLKVPDNLKLSEILSKLLPSILSIYFEPDFHNLAASSLLESPKMKALEEVINHLITKTNNSKGGVKIPIAKLLDLFHSEAYLGCKN